MRFIVNKKLYDTDKAELICTGLKKWDINAVVYARLSTSLYRTSKGTFFIVADDGKMHRVNYSTPLTGGSLSKIRVYRSPNGPNV